MIGKVFGRLSILRKVGGGRHGILWAYKCRCGNEGVGYGSAIRRGNIKSCGCLKKEHDIIAGRKLGKANVTHGMSYSSTYKSWAAMKNRCLNEKYNYFSLYGGRGIRVCKNWLKFENFLRDMGVRPEGKSLDRINVNGDYTPLNCRWANPALQTANRRIKRLENFSNEELLAELKRRKIQ